MAGSYLCDPLLKIERNRSSK